VKLRTKIILLVLALVIFLPVALVFYVISDINADGRLVEDNFMKHELNREIAARNPHWKADLQDVDVTSLFPAGMNEDEYKTALSLNGYSCELSSKSGAVCRADAGYGLVCKRRVVLIASFDDASTLKVVKARYGQICL
jgi:hypothetical protein